MTVACPRAWFAVILATVSVARPAAPVELATMALALVAVQEVRLAARLVVAARLTKRSAVMAACPREWSAVTQDTVSLDKSVEATVLAAIAQAEVAAVVAQVAALMTTTMTSPASLESPQHLPSTLPHSRPLRSSLSPRSTITSSLHSLRLLNLPASDLVAAMMETAAVAAAATMEEATVALSWCLASSWVSLPWLLFSSKL